MQSDDANKLASSLWKKLIEKRNEAGEKSVEGGVPAGSMTRDKWPSCGGTRGGATLTI